MVLNITKIDFSGHMYRMEQQALNKNTLYSVIPLAVLEISTRPGECQNILGEYKS